MPKPRAAVLSGVATTRVGELPGSSCLALHAEAAQLALTDAGLALPQIDGVLCAYSFVEPYPMMSSVFCEYIGLQPQVTFSLQLGGATAALEMARGYSIERYAFGRPVGSFQALKVRMADMYVKNELARSNCYYAAWALSTNAAELPLAAASARVAASDAYHFASKENIQIHGGMG